MGGVEVGSSETGSCTKSFEAATKEDKSRKPSASPGTSINPLTLTLQQDGFMKKWKMGSTKFQPCWIKS